MMSWASLRMAASLPYFSLDLCHLYRPLVMRDHPFNESDIGMSFGGSCHHRIVHGVHRPHVLLVCAAIGMLVS